MNGPQHYAEAERLLASAMLDDVLVEDGYAGEIAAAQVHATLAHVAAIVDASLNGFGPGAITGQPSAWARAVSS